MKNKIGIISLIIGSGFWCLTDVYWLIKRFTAEDSFKNSTVFELIFSFLNIIIPLSIFVFGISSLIIKEEEVTISEYLETENKQVN